MSMLSLSSFEDLIPSWQSYAFSEINTRLMHAQIFRIAAIGGVKL